MKRAIKCGAVVMLMLLGACVNGHATSEYCAVARPIYLSPSDDLSADTARQLLEHNEKGRALCGWRPIADESYKILPFL